MFVHCFSHRLIKFNQYNVILRQEGENQIGFWHHKSPALPQFGTKKSMTIDAHLMINLLNYTGLVGET